MQELLADISRLITSYHPFSTILIVLSLLYLAKHAANLVVYKVFEDIGAYLRAKKNINLLYYTALILALVVIFISNYESIAAVIGIIAVALTVVSKEFILNVLSFPLVGWKNLFNIGDRIHIAAYSGDVIDKGLLYFTLNETSQDNEGQSSGRIIHVPNSLCLTNSITNSTVASGYAWKEFAVLLDPKSDWKKAKALLLEAVAAYEQVQPIDYVKVGERMRNAGVKYRLLKPFVFVKLEGGGIRLQLRYLCEVRRKRMSAHMITETFLESIAGDEAIILK